MKFPQIICLNGTSSSGKTAIAKELQESLPNVYLNFSIDNILYALPDRALFRMTHGQEISDLNYPQLVRSFNACVCRLAEMGNFLVVDNAMATTEQVSDFLDSIRGFSTLLVGVHCALEELNRRERNRGNRTIGEAAAQIHRVHRCFIYDIEVDSTAQSPSKLAAEIMGYIQRQDELHGLIRTMEKMQRLGRG